MPRVIEKTVFKFAELSDRAKETARDWWRQCEDTDNDVSCDYEDAATCGALLGIDIRTKPVKLMSGKTRYDPAIYYSGFSSQGDGACFEGSYAYAKGCAKAIRKHAPQDTVLHGIADTLQAIQRHHRYSLQARMRHSGHYYHSGCMSVDIDTDDVEAEEGIAQCMRDFADWIYSQLKLDYEWRMADEQVDDNIEGNEYEFDEDGKIV